MRLVRLLPLVGVAAVAAAMGLSAGPAVAADGFTGSAYAVSAGTTLINSQTLGIPPVPFAKYPTGGNLSVIGVDDAQHKLVHSTKVLAASSEVKDGTLTSAGMISEVHVLDNLLHAETIKAECTADASGTKGSTVLVDAHVGHGNPDETRVRLDPNRSNQVEEVGPVKIVFNEQIKDGSKLTVNAVHIIVGGQVENLVRGDIILGQAVCAGTGAVMLPPTTNPAPPTTKTTTKSAAPGGPTATTGNGPAAPTTTAASSTDTTKKLANTGVSDTLPYVAIGGLALLGLGGGAIYLNRRRNRTSA